MGKIIAGVFESYSQAESAAIEVKNQGLKTEDISILRLDENSKTSNGRDTSFEGNSENSYTGDEISAGFGSGTAIGGAMGLLLGLGTVMIPGLGLIAAAGPIAGLVSGAVAGGIVGSLIDLGIPEHESREYEEDIRRGNVLWSMRVSKDNANDVADILRRFGAQRVTTY